MLAMLLVSPMAALAASGLPATITMTPTESGPGSSVEIVGLDFPGSQAIELQLTTTAGPLHLGTATTEEGGYFRHALTLPSDVAPGFWELRATAPDGAVAVHIFEATVAGSASAPIAPEAVVSESGGSSFATADLLVVLVLLLLVGGVGGAAAFVWYQTHRRDNVQPGMGAGDDPIWGGSP
jgi:hypothetical protein